MTIALAALLLACAVGARAGDPFSQDAQTVPAAKAAAPAKLLLYTTPDDKLQSQWVPKNELEESCPHCLVAIMRPGEAPRFFDSLRAYNRFLVQDCANSAVVGTRARIETLFKSLCRESPFILADVTRGSKVAYDIWKDKNGVHIGASVRFYITDDVDTARASKMIDEIAAKCPPKMASLLERYGIKFEADILSIQNPSIFATKATTPHAQIGVNLTDAFGRANSGQYYYAGQGHWMDCVTCTLKGEACAASCKGAISDSFCATMAHELGHTMGLPDEYADKDCPNRKGVSTDSRPWSLMDDHLKPWDQVELFPRHIAAIVRPLCKGSDAVITDELLQPFLSYRKLKP